jgi:hypothetical protein
LLSLFLDMACLAARGVKRARMESTEPSVRIIYNDLTRLMTEHSDFLQSHYIDGSILQSVFDFFHRLCVPSMLDYFKSCAFEYTGKANESLWN